MTDDRPLERAARSWLEEGPNRAPDRPVEAALARINTTRQERDLRIPWRFPTMFTNRVALAALAIVLIVAGGGLALSRLPGAGEVNPTPTSPVSQPPPTGRTPLPPGTHTTTSFQPPTTFTVPDGWVLEQDALTEFRIAPAIAGLAGGLVVCHGQVTAVDAANQPVPGVSDEATAILAAVGARPDLEVLSSPQPWALGDVIGAWMDVRNPGDTELAVVGGGACGNNLYPGGQNRFAVLDIADGSEILVTIYAYEGTEAFIEALTPVAESLRFATP